MASLDKLTVSENDDQYDDAELEELYSWIDTFPLTRPKKNLSRDFADGVPVAEIVKNVFPQAVEMHNFSPCSAADKKTNNWRTLNRKVFKRFNFEVDNDLIEGIVACKPGLIEKFLIYLRIKLNRAEWERQRQPPPVKKKHGRPESDKPEADQYVGTPGRSKGQVKGTKGHTKGPELWQEPTKGRTIRDPMEADVVPRLVFEEKAQENLAKDETIKILQAKCNRLEHLIHLKDMRIDDLQNRVEEMRPTGFRR
ncbi:hypothetical protein FSP39_001445 [Pinctada imbricata]|uniref:Calponin-homology (CH) domain-containing protein n=1 Tax=Pinctada imbricata TaxID=66713 RepID=A0AA89BTV6_PINIB|nr:hypothetical protein FSP39_001445 [Pinctada imbricata]